MRLLGGIVHTIITTGTAAFGAVTVAGLDTGIAHMASDILFKSLLFMAAGAVIYWTGRGRLSERLAVWRG